MLTELLCLLVVAPLGEPRFFDLKALGPHLFARVETGKKLEVVFYDGANAEAPLKTAVVVIDGPLVRQSHTPNGIVTSPAYVLIGGDQKRLFFQLVPAGIGVYDLETQTMTPFYLRHYDSVALVWPSADKILVATEMVTRTSSKIPCERSYFTWLDASGNLLSCYGEGKPFLEAFSAGDIPTVAYRPHIQESVVYYRKSGELFSFAASGQASRRLIDHHLVQLKTEPPTPQLLFALETDLVLVKRTPQAVSVFKLEHEAWTLQDRVEGDFTACIALSGQLVMLGPKGQLLRFPLAKIH